MTPVPHAITELRLVVQQAEARRETVRARANSGLVDRVSLLADHRTEIVGELIECLDRIDAGLGERLLGALYPLGTDEGFFDARGGH